MAVTVYFATNRALNGPADQVGSYTANIVAPSDPNAVTYGTAFVNDSNLTADTVGAITSIQDIANGQFNQDSAGDLSSPGRNLLVFVHGFDNSFENAITRAAFNQQWFAASGIAAANMTVVAFSWPSLGELLTLPFPDTAYRQDQTMAGQSGFHLMSFFANMQPLIESARAQGNRVTLLAHSMGNWALQAAIESWFAHGNGDAFLFEDAILAAADEIYTTFDFLPIGRLSALDRLARRISTYASLADDVLKLSMAINGGVQRLGQNGPLNRNDTARFPPDRYRVVDCGGITDYDVTFANSHQYYRRSPTVRTDIANTIGSPIPAAAPTPAAGGQAPTAVDASGGPPVAGTPTPAVPAPSPQASGVPSNAILAEFNGNGASAATAAQDHLPPGVEASFTMAKTDLPQVTPLKDLFNAAAALTGLPPALLAAIASRESRCGKVLSADGTGDFGNAFGIMRVNKRFHVLQGLPDPKSQGHINQASGILKDSLTAMIRKFPTEAAARQLQAAVAAYNCGPGAVSTPDTADNATTGHDYSNDVWERARFYALGW